MREPGRKTTDGALPDRLAGMSAPVYEMLERHAKRQAAAFHVPGHKQRADWRVEAADAGYERLLMLDVTELADTDDLHHPAGPIAEAQQLAAACFGAEETRFLVGGSTAGNLAMILGTTAPGDLLIVQRNVHRSIFHGLMLAGVRAVLLQPDIDAGSGLAVMPAADLVREAVRRYPEARGVVLGSPNYYGMSGDVRPIAEACHAAGMPLLVDEAHGAHFGLHPRFPMSALQAGTDVVVQSTHKMLGAMTMGAMLHMQGRRIDRQAVRQALRMVQSSSPSFPLLASLDLARSQVHAGGSAAFAPALAAAASIRARLPRTAFRAIESGRQYRQDPLKLVLYDVSGTMSGFRIRDELEARDCVIEMADARYAVLALGIGTRQEDADRLIEALTDMSGRLPAEPAQGMERQTPMQDDGQPLVRSNADAAARPDLSQDEDLPSAVSEAGRRDADDIPLPTALGRTFPPTERVRLEDSAGRIAGEWVVPYPPGIPELYPGEVVTQSTIQRLLRWRRQRAQIQGAEDGELMWLRVAVLT